MSRPDSIGALLARARLARGWSQLRLAELLCAAAGQATITRHEVSRWEREERIPSAHWLGWLGAVLEVEADELGAAVAVARQRRAVADDRPAPVDPSPLWTLDDSPPWTDEAAYPQSLDGLAARIGELRRMDDLVGGLDLVGLARGELGAALARARRQPTRRRLRLVAELAQLAGWTAADAGLAAEALRAYHLGLSVAAGAGDRGLGAHLLGCLSHLAAGVGDPREALLLAHTGQAAARQGGSAGVRALLLHRVAYAAAVAGERRTGEQALARAEQAADRRVAAREPSWLYWLDDGELSALTGRCFTALRRPLRAAPLLCRRLGGRDGDRGRPRTRALDGGALVAAYLDVGEPEQAAEVAETALLDAVRSGSARAAARVLAPAAPLVRMRAGAGYAATLAACRPYLPGVEVTRKRACG